MPGTPVLRYRPLPHHHPRLNQRRPWSDFGEIVYSFRVSIMVKPRRALALYLSSCLLSALPALAPLQAQAEQAQGDQPTRACSQPQGTLDETIASCSAVIEAGSVSGRELAAAYAQRGFAR